MEVVAPGMFSLIQDWPGRSGLWRVGVPPSGPMDAFAFRIANRLVRNPEGTAALEITFSGPTITFKEDTVVALTGAQLQADLDGKQVPFWASFAVKAGNTLTLGAIQGAGARAYLSVAGGFAAPDYLGSKSSFPLGKLGGATGDGRPLAPGDILGINAPPAVLPQPQELPRALVPAYGKEWVIGVVPGPQEAPEYLTGNDVSKFYDTNWEVSHNASRLGVRLIGPKLEFARKDGGEGGSHPSNLHDNAYAIGSINFTGDHPVILMVDGPSLGGFICPATIPSSELWKIGQVQPQDSIRFRKMTIEEALKSKSDLDHISTTLTPPAKAKAPTVLPPAGKAETKSVLHVREATATTPRAEYRIAGDRYIMVEYGPLVLDINMRLRIHLLETWLRSQMIAGLEDTIPGVRSMLIQYDSQKLPLNDLLQVLQTGENELANPETVKVPSRVFKLPMAFKDRWNNAAIEKYMATVRSKAAYLPCNVDFVAKNNGLAGPADVERVVYDASYMVLGLGDVYLGAPCAVPLDPRHRLVVPKYNPARTFTPEGAVGIGGQYMCIYPMESPGGYQLIGRTLPIWNTAGIGSSFTPSKPWLLDMFDQVRFQRVSEDELEKQREAFKRGELMLDVSQETFDASEYNKFLKSIQGEANALKKQQKAAQAIQLDLDSRLLREENAALEGTKLVTNFLADMVINGPNHPGTVPGVEASPLLAPVPQASSTFPSGSANSSHPPPRGFKQLFDEQGPEAFAKAVRQHKGLLLTDTTWRDAHQSLLATRMRTTDILKIAPATAHALASCFSLESWGGATFDVALRFLHECPWERLEKMRELVPNVPFQMLLRGANAVGYTSYPDNVVYDFCKLAKRSGMDVFRIFDSVNYVENLYLGIDAVGRAGGIVEAVICYSGDVASPKETKYTLDYYLNLARLLAQKSIHVLCIKDMAGLLKPRAATLLIGALRREFPDLPIHVHTHDTAGTGVASMMACYEAGADAVDCCNDAMSGLTSQPSMGALIQNYADTEHDTGIQLPNLLKLTSYWEATRRQYAPFESGQKSAGADVYVNEIPGGQYTNMLFQATSLGLATEWDNVKSSYAAANRVLGNIVKVTPSSKVVGDLAQFMVTNKLDEHSVVKRASELNFPSSVVDFLQGGLGIPIGGFPEPFRSRVLKELPRIEGRPGASMESLDLSKLKVELEKKWGPLRDVDVMSSAQYPAVFTEYATHKKAFGEVTNLPTRQFLTPMRPGDHFSFSHGGKNFIVTLSSVGEKTADGVFPVTFDINGVSHTTSVKPKKGLTTPFYQQTAAGASAQPVAEVREKADKAVAGSIGAPMPGKVISLKVELGQQVIKGAPIVVLSAMKMETQVTAPISGTVSRIIIAPDDSVSAGDLLIEIKP